MGRSAAALSVGVSREDLARLRTNYRRLLNCMLDQLEPAAGKRILVSAGDAWTVDNLVDRGCHVTVVSCEVLAGQPYHVEAGLAIDIVECEFTELPMPDNSYDHAVVHSMHEWPVDLRAALGQLARVVISGNRLIFEDKVYLGLLEPSLEEEAEFLFHDLARAADCRAMGLTTVEKYVRVLERAGFSVEEQRVWADDARVTIPDQVNLPPIVDRIALLEDRGLQSRFSDRLSRLLERAPGRQAVCPRWSVVVVHQPKSIL